MAVELREAGTGDRDTIVGLLDEYLEEIAVHREIPVGATNARSYLYLDAYFCDPGRHAFLIVSDGAVVGFALIRGPISTGGPASQVAEFYIGADSRRRGLGRDAVALIWRRFPGAWEFQVHAKNVAALRFWVSCVSSAGAASPDVKEVHADDGKRFQFNFHVGCTS